MVQRGHAVFQGAFAVLLEEELRVGQTRPHHALVALDHRAGVGGGDVAHHQKLVRQLALCVEQGEVFLVGLHRQDQAFLRHREKVLVELAQQHIRALDQGGDLVEQRRGVDRPQIRAGARCGGLQLRGDLGAARAETGDHRALAAQHIGIAVGGRQHDGVNLRFEAVTVGLPTRDEPQRLHRHHVGAMQRHQTMRRADELDRAPAIGQLIRHDLGDGQSRQGIVQRGLQAVEQRHAGGHGVDEQRLRLAFALAPQPRRGAGVQPEAGELFQQRGRGRAAGVQADCGGHELLGHRTVSGLGRDMRDVRSQSARAGVGRDHRIGCDQPQRLEALGQTFGKGAAQRGDWVRSWCSG
jgi:hypothetical protein